jgi:plasmid stabilization system protein ParE
VEQAIYDACAFGAKAPLRGHLREDVTRLAVRFWTVVRYPKYVIVYDPAGKPLRIIRILHGAKYRSRVEARALNAGAAR